MRLRIGNEGDTPVRVIIDHDTINDTTLDAGAEEVFDAPNGIIELRELEMGMVPAGTTAES
ncbi:hypothetical protein [Paraburkholderia sacchari]|uniref:hypothetical protein n=1 Tax=Paraburkholderia sacchari TaxID=159450 RepID=UPI0005444A1B|nr:hypothetical protein [Paraburkholderia sacchari]NLP65381.1 hypothetical protein [Paraburkholderia sacchari]